MHFMGSRGAPVSRKAAEREKAGQVLRRRFFPGLASVCLLAFAEVSFTQLPLVPVHRTSIAGAYFRIENAATEQCLGAEKDVLTEVPIGRIDPVPDPADLPQPLAPQGSNEQDDPAALNQRAPAAPRPSTQQKEGQPHSGQDDPGLLGR